MLLEPVIEYQLKRTRSRKTITLKIKNGDVIVNAPKWLPKFTINKFIADKQEWIQKKLEESLANDNKKSFTEGEEFLFLGKSYELQTINSDHDAIELIENQLICKTSKKTKLENTEKIQIQIKNWYKQEAHKTLISKTKELAKITNLLPQKIKIGDYKSKWGSCNSKKTITLNWKLIMADPEIIKYVIIHELCHLQEMNHSQRFWHLVENFYPNYKQAKKWLKQNGQLLSIN